MTEVRKSRLGDAVSAAVPKLWAVLRANNWSQGDLARELRERGHAKATPSLVNRWLHGDQKPGRPYARTLDEAWGVGQNLWDEPLRRPFVLQVTEAKAS